MIVVGEQREVSSDQFMRYVMFQISLRPGGSKGMPMVDSFGASENYEVTPSPFSRRSIGLLGRIPYGIKGGAPPSKFEILNPSSLSAR